MSARTYRVRTARGLMEFSPTTGHVLPHEHVIIDSRIWWEGPGEWSDFDDPWVLSRTTWDELAERPQALVRENLLLSDWYLGAKELRLATSHGLKLLVDLTVLGCGPSVDMVVRAADLAGVDIVISVGRYLDPTLTGGEAEIGIAELAERWVRQITEGIDGFLPGIIGEIGTSAEITETERVSLQAAALAGQQTGLSINIHVHPFAKRAAEAIDVIERAGADLSRVAISHLDCEIDAPQLLGLLRRGVYIEMDNFGTSRTRKVAGIGYPNDGERLDLIEALLDEGFGQQLLLSHDINHRNSLRTNGGWGYAHIGKQIIPALIERFGTDTCQLLVAENPLRLLDITYSLSAP